MLGIQHLEFCLHFGENSKIQGKQISSSTFGGKEGHWEGYVLSLVLWDIEVASVINRKVLARAGSWFMTEG